MTELTHIDELGQANMVDVSAKSDTERVALAQSFIHMQPSTLQAILDGDVAKGEVFATARIAGIQGAKRCADLIPLCHPLALRKVTVRFAVHQPDRVEVLAECKVIGPTGVEMEALTAASVACLTLYDMCKALDRGMTIETTRLLEKSGGRSGHYRLEADRAKPAGQQPGDHS